MLTRASPFRSTFDAAGIQSGIARERVSRGRTRAGDLIVVITARPTTGAHNHTENDGVLENGPGTIPVIDQ
jgi:hypothetical protein